MATHPDAELAIMRKARKAEIPHAEAWAARTATLTAQAKREGWKPSELAVSIADVTMAAQQAYGEEFDILGRPKKWKPPRPAAPPKRTAFRDLPPNGPPSPLPEGTQ